MAQDVFNRSVPTVESSTPIAVAGTLLDLPHRDVILIANASRDKLEYLVKRGKWLAFAGYPVLEKLISTAPADFFRYMYRPCRSASLTLDLHGPQTELADVLQAFSKTRFGYALIKSPNSFGLLTLTDLLSAYGEIFDTDLRVADISEPVVSLPGETRLADAVREFFKRRIRRVCIRGTNSFVSDREVLSFIFSPRRMKFSKKSPGKTLDATLEELESVNAIETSPDLVATEAASIIRPGSTRCLVIRGGERMVTPWDLVMKPYLKGRLKIRSPSRKGGGG